MTNPDALRRAIVAEEARLAQCEKERADALARLERLKNQLAAVDRALSSQKPMPSDRLPFPSKVPSTRAACSPKNSFSMGWLTISESIRAASEIPIDVDLTDEDAVPAYMKIAEKVCHLRRLGMTYNSVAERLGINLWMAKRAATRVHGFARLPSSRRGTARSATVSRRP
jgi:hypothetical protein